MISKFDRNELKQFFGLFRVCGGKAEVFFLRILDIFLKNKTSVKFEKKLLKYRGSKGKILVGYNGNVFFLFAVRESSSPSTPLGRSPPPRYVALYFFALMYEYQIWRISMPFSNFQGPRPHPRRDCRPRGARIPLLPAAIQLRQRRGIR